MGCPEFGAKVVFIEDKMTFAEVWHRLALNLLATWFFVGAFRFGLLRVRLSNDLCVRQCEKLWARKFNSRLEWLREVGFCTLTHSSRRRPLNSLMSVNTRR